MAIRALRFRHSFVIGYFDLRPYIERGISQPRTTLGQARFASTGLVLPTGTFSFGLNPAEIAVGGDIEHRTVAAPAAIGCGLAGIDAS